MLTTSKKGIGWLLAVSLLFVIVAITYWWNNNTKAPICETKVLVTGLVQKSITNEFISREAEVKSVEKVMSGDNTNADIQKEFTAFKTEWSKGKKLEEKRANEFAESFTKLYRSQANKFSAKAGNQLMAVLIILFIVVLFLWLAFYTNILRDITGNPVPLDIETAHQRNMIDCGVNSGDRNLTVLPPYSLSRTQLAIWITIIGCVYTYAVLWDDLPLISINNTALLLMGISGGTFAAGAILDTSEIEQNIPRHQDVYRKGNFFKDILSDKNGISIHRFQNVVWTIIAIFVYFYKFSNPVKGSEKGLPDLDQTLLALTGISSATYLVLKSRENIGQKKLVNLSITLTIDPANALGPSILASEQGLRASIINVIDNAGNISHAKPDPANSKTTFIAVVEPEKLFKVEVAWSGEVSPVLASPPAPATTVSLSGMGEGTAGKDSASIAIQLK
ncbi:MAG: hypothetical protein NTW29_03070 [Bacteroidetes bacterium]|nr:hypothetical protein [Bacteroidota bacterium]